MLNAIDLFSGYGGITLALREYARPIVYCEIERYAQGILLSNFDKGTLPFAPIWNDVTTLDGTKFRGMVDIIYGGFPCQDISCAGKGAGLEGKRSGLFYEVIRICKEASPLFIFLENVAAIRTRGSIEVQEELASIGYDCRFGMLSAAEVGANHKRDRWFCLAIRRDLANPKSEALERFEEADQSREEHSFEWVSFWNGSKSSCRKVADTCSKGLAGQREINFAVQPEQYGPNDNGRISGDEEMADSICPRQQGQRWVRNTISEEKNRKRETNGTRLFGGTDNWIIEPDVGRVANGIKFRSHRVKALGNGVVPLQVKTAFEILMGIKV